LAEVKLRYPKFDLKFYTEDDEYHITYDARKDFSNEFTGESVIQLSTKNAMEEDTATFSLVLAGDVYWDRILQANDAVVLKIDPNEGGEKPQNPVLLVGLVSEVRQEADHGENSKMYRITGQSFAKAFTNFEIGVIQEVATQLTDIGWLPNSTEDGGFEMTQKTAAQMVESIVEHFLPYIKYNYSHTKKGIEEFLTWKLDSWVQEERLADETNFINYEGSLKQMLEDATARPFNELFFEATEDEQCELVLRRTPFDPEDWNHLTTYTITSKELISESVGLNDAESFSIFNISQKNNMLGASDVDLSAYPQYFKPLLDKFGYKELQVENLYLDTAVAEDSEEDDSEETEDDNDDTEEAESEDDSNEDEGQSFATMYNLVTNYLANYGRKKIRVVKDKVTKQIQNVDKRITKAMAQDIMDFYMEGKEKWSREAFSKLTGFSLSEEDGQKDKPDADYQDVRTTMDKSSNTNVTDLKNELVEKYNISEDQAVNVASEYLAEKLNKERFKEIMDDRSAEGMERIGTSKQVLIDFKKRLANWYCENPNFYSGDITVQGSPEYRLGGRLIVQDEQNGEIWEYYIESVEQTFSYTEGYITTLGVTRGLQNGGQERFTNLWGTSEDFKGGYMGEMSMEELLELQAKEDEKNQQEEDDSNEDSDDSGDASSIPGSSIAVKAANFGKSMSKEESSHSSYYSWGGGRGSDPFKSEPYAMDCSSFVWWCFEKAGQSLAGGKGGMTTWTIKGDKNLKTVNPQGAKAGAKAKMKVGDIIMFYPSNGHIGIYLGGDKWVGCNGKPPTDHSSTAGIHVKSLSGFWWGQFNGHVLRLP